jgi:hypothetical protein
VVLLVWLPVLEVALEAIANAQQGTSSKRAIETGGKSDRDRSKTIHFFAPWLNKISCADAMAL